MIFLAAGTSAASQIFGLGMLPLWLCSFALFALAANRFRALRTGRVLDSPTLGRVREAIARGDVGGAREAASSSSAVVPRAWAEGLRQYQLGGIPLQEALGDATAAALKPLRANLNHIATIGVIAPMIGLIGTVVGMILTFSALAETGQTDKTKLAAGLAFALYKTAGGLIVAIPAIVLGRYFQGKISAFAAQAEQEILQAHYAERHRSAQAAQPSSEHALT
jgi:biopolymer transport protein ExbB